MSERASAYLASLYCSGATKATVPRQVARPRQPIRSLQVLAQPQVGEFGLPVARQKNVVGFNVAVNQAGSDGAAKGVGHLEYDANGLVLRDAAPVHDMFREISPIDEFHDQVALCAVHAKVHARTMFG